MNAQAEAPPFGLTARSALLRALLVLWLPVVVPLVTGMLRDCGHCQSSYLLSLPIVPGLLVPALFGLDDAWFFVVGGAVTLLLFGGLALLLYELPRPYALVVQAIAALGVTAVAIGYVMALRA